MIELLNNDERRERIALAGHRRVQEHRLGRRIGELQSLLSSPGSGRPESTQADRVLGRAVAMLLTWAPGDAIAAAALAANHLTPCDPRALNLLALATLRWRGVDGGETAWQLLHRALQVSPSYVPAATNLAALATAAHDQRMLGAIRDEVDRLAEAPSWDGSRWPNAALRLRRTCNRSFADAANGGSLGRSDCVRGYADQLVTRASPASSELTPAQRSAPTSITLRSPSTTSTAMPTRSWPARPS